MTERTFQLVQRLSSTVSVGFSSGRASVYASAGQYFGCLVRNTQTGELMLPVKKGAGFGLVAENSTTAMAAFPARLGTADGDWLNVFAECGITDLAHMPSTGGMMEVRPHERFKFDGLLLPGGKKAPFTVNTNDASRHYDRIEIGYRFPLEPDKLPGMPAGATSRGVSIGFGPVTDQERIITDLGYEKEVRSFGVIRLVDRVKMADDLANDGLSGLDPDDDLHWSASYLEDRGVPIVAHVTID